MTLLTLYAAVQFALLTWAARNYVATKVPRESDEEILRNLIRANKGK